MFEIVNGTEGVSHAWTSYLGKRVQVNEELLSVFAIQECKNREGKASQVLGRVQYLAGEHIWLKGSQVGQTKWKRKRYERMHVYRQSPEETSSSYLPIFFCFSRMALLYFSFE